MFDQIKELERENILKYFRILYIDNDDNLREEISNTLKLYRINVTTSLAGKYALEKFKKGKYDLIICNIELSQTNGITMMKNIRYIDSEIPFIFTTELNNSQYLLTAIGLKKTDYLIKPFKTEDLVSKIEHIIEPILQKREMEKHKDIIDSQAKELLINRLLLTISHQWITPLSVICATTTKLKLLLEMENLDMQVLDNGLSKIEYQATEMSNILSDFNKLMDSRGEKKIILRDLIENIIYFLQKLFNKQQVEYILSIDNYIFLNCKQYEFVLILLIVLQNIIESNNNIEPQHNKININTRYEEEYLILEISHNLNSINQIKPILNKLIENTIQTFFDGKIQNNEGSTLLYISKTKLIR